MSRPSHPSFPIPIATRSYAPVASSSSIACFTLPRTLLRPALSPALEGFDRRSKRRLSEAVGNDLVPVLVDVHSGDLGVLRLREANQQPPRPNGRLPPIRCIERVHSEPPSVSWVVSQL
jgi:hypothetical protein